jgi:hypothetical protein
MPPLPLAYLTKVGPLDFRGGKVVAMYVAFSAEGETLATEVEAPPDDAKAVRKLVARLPTHAPCCALELAKVGAALGVEPRDLPPRVAAERAVVAYHALLAGHVGMGMDGPRELGAAGAEYLRAEPWEKLSSSVRYSAKGTFIDHASGRSDALPILLHVQDGDHPDGPSLQLDESLEVAMAADDTPDDAAPLRLRVTLASEPEWAADVFMDAFGVRFFPRVAFMLGGKLLPPDDSQAVLLAAALRATAAHASGGIGRASSGTTEAIVEVDFTKELAAEGMPARDTPAGRRAWGRIVAHVLAATVPIPYHTGFACVVVDPTDATGLKVWAALEKMAAQPKKKTSRLHKEFDGVFDDFAQIEGLVGRWMPSLTMSQMFARELGDASAALVVENPPPVSLRVMYVGGGAFDSFHVDFDPKDTERLAAELAESRRAEKFIERGQQRRKVEPPAPPPAIEGTWRDGRTYLPDPLPADWTIGRRGEQGQLAVTAGGTTFDIGGARREGRRWVTLIFGARANTVKPISYDEARGVFEKLRGCGRFSEMQIEENGEALPTLGIRVFSAPITKVRQQSKVPETRSEEVQAALIERAKPHLGQVVAMAGDARRPISDFAVIMEAEVVKDGRPDGVVVTKELVAKIFASRENDPFDIRGRFEEPRPEHECVIFVKHADGIEEIAVSLESVEVGPEVDA